MSNRQEPMKVGKTERQIRTRVLPALALAGLAGLATASPASAQWRFGVTVGYPTGIGVVVDYRPWERNGLELKIARSFGVDLPSADDAEPRRVSWFSVSFAAKQYWGSGDWERHVGAGVTFVNGGLFQGVGDDRTEDRRWVLLTTVPVGLDWKAGRQRTIGLTGNLIALPIPFPELSYRWGPADEGTP